MIRRNGKTEVEEQRIDAEHELPAAEDDVMARGAGQATEVEKLRAERDALLDRQARMQAQVDTVKAIIPVLDSFERALRSSPEKSGFRAGVELIYKQLQDALAKLGVK